MLASSLRALPFSLRRAYHLSGATFRVSRCYRSLINVIINITDLAGCELAGNIIHYLIRNDLLRIVNDGTGFPKINTPWLSPLTGLISVISGRTRAVREP
jgi:hypothetical protein